MADHPVLPKRPYLLRAMHQWMTDSGHTPHVIVDAERPGVKVPRPHVKDGKIVLNISFAATQRLDMGNEYLELDARFGGAIFHVQVPVGAVLGIYARETGEGMVFSDQDLGSQPEPAAAGSALPAPPAPEKAAEPGRPRPTLRVIK
ncbi:MAG TPA: ClpXP protease specificity-enhancing factor [Steroidobacteraceae bacterium]|nr:ClpXP protease specificity-enhancing factor [Steroidobacteraceae bacterium]